MDANVTFKKISLKTKQINKSDKVLEKGIKVFNLLKEDEEKLDTKMFIN